VPKIGDHNIDPCFCVHLIEKREGEAGRVKDGEQADRHDGHRDRRAEQEDERENLKRKRMYSFAPKSDFFNRLPGLGSVARIFWFAFTLVTFPMHHSGSPTPCRMQQ
jgi:hypothetical protein